MNHMFDISFDTDRWYLLSTKSKSEKIELCNLNYQGHDTFLPMLFLTGKPMVLFPGYIFVKPRKGASYSSINSTRGVRKFIRFENIFPKVSEDLIEFLRTRMDYFETLANSQKKYQKGQLVQIENGPFKDFEAIFDEYDKNQNVFILLKFLERTQRVKLNQADIN